MNSLEGLSLTALESKLRFCAPSRILLYSIRVKKISVSLIAEYCNSTKSEVEGWLIGKDIPIKSMAKLLQYFDPIGVNFSYDELLRITKNEYLENSLNIDSESVLKEVSYSKQVNLIWSTFMKLGEFGYQSFENDSYQILDCIEKEIVLLALKGKSNFIYIIPPVGHLNVSKSPRLDETYKFSKKFKIENKAYEQACENAHNYIKEADLFIVDFDYVNHFVEFDSDEKNILDFADNYTDKIFKKLSMTQLKNLKALEIELINPDVIPIYPEQTFNSYLLAWVQTTGKDLLRKAIKRVINDQKTDKITHFIVNEFRPEINDHGFYEDSENVFFNSPYPHLYCDISADELDLILTSLGYVVNMQDIPQDKNKFLVDQDFLLEKKILRVTIPKSS